MTIRDLLMGLCEKLCINLAAVDLFLVGGEKVQHYMCWLSKSFQQFQEKQNRSQRSKVHFLNVTISVEYK